MIKAEPHSDDRQQQITAETQLEGALRRGISACLTREAQGAMSGDKFITKTNNPFLV